MHAHAEARHSSRLHRQPSDPRSVRKYTLARFQRAAARSMSMSRPRTRFRGARGACASSSTKRRRRVAGSGSCWRHNGRPPRTSSGARAPAASAELRCGQRVERETQRAQLQNRAQEARFSGAGTEAFGTKGCTPRVEGWECGSEWTREAVPRASAPRSAPRSLRRLSVHLSGDTRREARLCMTCRGRQDAERSQARAEGAPQDGPGGWWRYLISVVRHPGGGTGKVDPIIFCREPATPW